MSKQPPRKTNFWDALIVSMNKGQLPLFAGAALIAVVIVRLPAGDVTSLANRIVDLIAKGQLLGWLLFMGTVLGWIFHGKRQRRIAEQAIPQITEERNYFQQKVIDLPVESTKPGKAKKRLKETK